MPLKVKRNGKIVKGAVMKDVRKGDLFKVWDGGPWATAAEDARRTPKGWGVRVAPKWAPTESRDVIPY